MKKILITGASGFIGRNIFEHLSLRDDLKVYGTYRSQCVNPDLLQIDLTHGEHTLDLLSRVKPDILIHAAALTAGGAEVKKNPEAYLADNVIMNMHLISAAHKIEIPQCIFLGCAVAYPPEDRLVKEPDIDYDGRNTHPRYRSFAAVKVTMEQFCRAYAEFGKTHFIVIRHSNMYGPYDKFSGGGHFFSTMLAEIDKHENGGTIRMGPGTERRDLMHISDLLRLIEIIVDHQTFSFEVCNAGLGISYSLREIADKMVMISGKQITLIQDASGSSLPTQPALDSTRAYLRFGWSPRISLDEGIKMTMEWLKRNK